MFFDFSVLVRMTTKTCSVCKFQKDINDFGKCSSSSDGYRWQCKPCRRKEYEAVAEEKKTALRERYANDPEFREAAKARVAERYDRSDVANKKIWKTRARKSTLKKYFQMTPEEYAVKAAEQGNVCAICQRGATEANKHKKDLDVDHDHKCCPDKRCCGKCVRGLLCHSCNLGIGYLQDSPELLAKAIVYLQSHNPPTTHPLQ